MNNLIAALRSIKGIASVTTNEGLIVCEYETRNPKKPSITAVIDPATGAIETRGLKETATRTIDFHVSNRTYRQVCNAIAATLSAA